MNYFEWIEKKTREALELANRAKAKSFDPDPKVDIPLAKDMFERVENLVGAIKPEIVGSGLAKRLKELDREFGSGDWRVALKIAYEVAQGKFCPIKNTEEGIELGIRVGLAYITQGVVSAPLEGFIEFKIKQRKDGGKYGACYFAGPIRAAGGTAAAVTVIIADYLRLKFGLDEYDPTPEEIARYIHELEEYHTKIARLQYYPRREEVEFLIKHIPVEVTGDATTDKEVLIHKDLDRVEVPNIRGGMCLVLAEGIAQKAAKIAKKLDKLKEFGLKWEWILEYVKLKESLHAAAKEESTRIKPNTVYIEEAVAGRPVFAHPLARGGFRIRYGRTRLTGLAACAIHPATMRILDDFIASGTQLRLERPGKACAVTPCETIHGPVVKLDDESVVIIRTEEEAHRLRKRVKEVLFLGDILIATGEFSRNNHVFVPSPWVHEWWVKEVEKVLGEKPKRKDFGYAVSISLKYGVPLHPDYVPFYSHLQEKELIHLLEALEKARISDDKVIFHHDKFTKKILEDILWPHRLSEEGILVEGVYAKALLYTLGFLPDREFKTKEAKAYLNEGLSTLEIINRISKVKVRDKAGVYVGARLGRPEKAKMRKLKGRPHMLFPVGQQGGRMRSLNEAVNKGFVEAEFPLYYCRNCKRDVVYPRCPYCGEKTELLRVCQKCGKRTWLEKHCGLPTQPYQSRKFPIREEVERALKNLGVELPKLVKGVRGTSNRERIPEPIEKGILRAIHNVYVNKDGTIRFDAIEAPVTHFKPAEVGVSIEKLRELGYTHDIHGEPLTNPNQILELKPQDVILPDCDWHETSAAKELIKICNFVDELLVRYYKVEPYYNVKSKEDLIGHLIIGLAPHTSAGVVGRIVGFSKSQCFYAHPFFHSACRRNCDGDEIAFMLLLDAFLNFSRKYLPDKRGSRHMDAPLVLTTKIDPKEIDDEAYEIDAVWEYPLDFYYATLEWRSPKEFKVKRVEDNLGTEQQYSIPYTHEVINLNSGNMVSAYKSLNSIPEKVARQMELAKKLRCVDKKDVARIVIEKHFLKDIKGNLSKFGRQEFRCVNCNEKYRRIPLVGKCTKCGGRIVLTVAEGTVSKYLEPSIRLAEEYDLDSYLKQVIKMTKLRVESVFGKEPVKQTTLTKFVK